MRILEALERKIPSKTDTIDWSTFLDHQFVKNWVIEVLPSQRVRKKKCDFHNRYDGSCDYDEYFLYGGAVGSNDSWVSEPLHTEGYLTHYRELSEIYKKQTEEHDKKYPYGVEFHNVWKDFI